MNWLPKELDDVNVAFPTSVDGMMPAYRDIPDEFKCSTNKWNKLFGDWFYAGLAELELTPKEGVDKDKALRHIRYIMRSWDPKHEHKEAGIAFLLNEWFEDAKWSPKR